MCMILRPIEELIEWEGEAVYADKAYCSEAISKKLEEKGRRNKPLTEERYIGLLANRVHLFLTVFTYNLIKLKNNEMKRSLSL